MKMEQWKKAGVALVFLTVTICAWFYGARWLDTPEGEHTAAPIEVISGVPESTPEIETGELRRPVTPSVGTIPDTSTITGRVTKSQTGEGIAGISVMTRGSERIEGVTDDTGQYTIESLYPGNWEIMVDGGGGDMGAPTRFASTHFTIFDYGTTKGPDFSLNVGYTVTGRVVDESRNPIPKAHVILKAGYMRLGSATTNEAGEFTFFGRPVDRKLTLFVLENGYAEFTSDEFAIPANGTIHRDLLLKTGSSIAGRVVDQHGHPVSYPIITALDSEGIKRPQNSAELVVVSMNSFSVRTGAPINPPHDGSFRVDYLSAGTYHLYAHTMPVTNSYSSGILMTPEFELTGEPLAIVSLVTGEQREDVTLSLHVAPPVAKATVTVTGTVTDENGAPLAGATVDQEMKALDTTDDQGRFTAAVQPDFPGGMMIRAQGFLTRQVREPLKNGTHVDVELIRTTPIRGHVVDAETDEPIERFKVSTDTPRRNWPVHKLHFAQPESSSSGHFQVVNRRPLPAYYSVQAHGYLINSVRVDEPSQAEEEILFEMVRSPIVNGQVIDMVGDPIPHAQIYFDEIRHRFQLGESPHVQADLYADTEGRFRIALLSRDIHQLSAYHPDHSLKTVPTDFSAGDTHELSIQLSKGATIVGTVFWKGRPIADLRLEARQRIGNRDWNRGGQTDEYGRYRISGLPDGDWSLRAYLNVPADNGDFVRYAERDRTQLKLPLEGTATEDFKFGNWNTAVRGTVRHDKETTASIQFSRSDKSSRGEVRVSNGSYEIVHIPPGEYELELTVSPSEGASLRKTEMLTVVEGQVSELNFSLGGFYTVTGTIHATANVQSVTISAVPGRPKLGEIEYEDIASTDDVSRGDTYTLNLPEPGIYTIGAAAHFSDGTFQKEPTVVIVEVQADLVYTLDFEM